MSKPSPNRPFPAAPPAAAVVAIAALLASTLTGCAGGAGSAGSESSRAYLGTLSPPRPLPIGFLPDGRALTVETDAMDVQRLVVGRFVEGGERGTRS